MPRARRFTSLSDAELRDGFERTLREVGIVLEPDAKIAELTAFQLFKLAAVSKPALEAAMQSTVARTTCSKCGRAFSSEDALASHLADLSSGCP